MKLTIKNVRCFADQQTFNIRPLTFLVGENSTGKTTMLGCFQVLKKLLYTFYHQSSLNPNFNQEPFQMGAFQNIIRRPAAGRGDVKNKAFEVGCILDKPQFSCQYSFKEKNKGAEPAIHTIIINYQNNKIGLSWDHKNHLKISLNDKKFSYSIKCGYVCLSKLTSEEIKSLSYLTKPNPEKEHTIKTTANHFEKMAQFVPYRKEIVSLAPMRSKPKRTYDPIGVSPNPEGTEVPMYLMNLYTQNKKAWKELHKSLVRFGKTSGLFKDIKVKQFGDSTADPFQLQFKITEPYSNIIDTGDGVSQILPLLVRILLSSEDFHFSLQQPEVHLHPRAQAEFTSLLIRSIKAKSHHFLIETHSDYMVDRARIAIQKGKISHKDVSLIYLEHKGEAVKAHNISFDKHGNMMGTPADFRSFFLKETDDFLGFQG